MLILCPSLNVNVLAHIRCAVPSRASQPSQVTVSPTLPAFALFTPEALHSTVEIFRVVTAPSLSLTSTFHATWGLIHSIFLIVPVTFSHLLLSYSALKE